MGNTVFTNYNSVQFSEVNRNELQGVSLIYRSERKDGTCVETCVHLGGDDFTPTNGTENETFRVWKNAIKLHWDAKRAENGLKVDNGGIGIRLKSSTPAEIVVRTVNGKVSFKWAKEDSVFARVGIIPTKKDLEECARDYKKKMHKAAMASFKALKMKFEFEAAETGANDEKAAA